MALQVTDFGQWAEATSAPAIGNLAGDAFTFAALYRFSTADGGTVLGVGSSGSSQYVALGMTAAGQGFLEVGSADAFADNNFAANSWHSLVGVQSTFTSRVFYADGVAGTVNTNSASVATAQLDRSTIGALVVNGNHISTANGDIAECAIWDVALTANEAAALAAFVCPLLIRPDHLLLYCPAKGTASAELDLVGGRVLTWGGTSGTVPVVTSHPAVALPLSGPAVPPTAAVTHEAASWSSSYVTLGRQVASWASSWTTRTRAAVSWTSGYEARQRLLGAWSSAYVCRGRVAQSWASSFTTRARAASSWQSGWATDTRGLAGWSSGYVVSAHPTIRWASSYVVASPMIVLAAGRGRAGGVVAGRTGVGGEVAEHD